MRVSEESMRKWESNRRPGETIEQYIPDAAEARKELAEGRCVPHEEVR